MPKVSALMPVYNSNLAYLKDTIESVLNQSFADFEFLILNDSPQNLELESFILEYAKKDKRIKYFKNERNLGISPSRNKLVELAQGEFLAVIDHDDISVKERFEKQVAFLETNKEVGVVGGGIQTLKKRKNKFYLQKSKEIVLCLMVQVALMHPATMMRASVLRSINIRYNELYSPAEDYKLWCDLLGKTDFANLDEVMIYYRDYENTSYAKADLMGRVSKLIINQNATNHPELFSIVSHLSDEVVRVSFCGLPLLKIIKNCIQTSYLLFHKIPIFRVKKQIYFRKF